MKWAIIIINLLAAVMFPLLGSVASAIHHTHSYSMYREFVAVGAVDEEKLKKGLISEKIPPTPYDMPARMQQIGNVESWFNMISLLAATTCLLNAGVIFVIMKKPGHIPLNPTPV